MEYLDRKYDWELSAPVSVCRVIQIPSSRYLPQVGSRMSLPHVATVEMFAQSQGVLVGHGVGGFLALQYFAEYRKRAAERLVFLFEEATN